MPINSFNLNQGLWQGAFKTEFSETIKEAGVHAFGPVMKACEAAGTSFFGGKFKISVACFE